ncbi:MAG: tetratricopeptide repeat protein, partial [Actinomycetia bacterium]|nr:tetratricopeptide repeat protein [Actinomycetes bacterium]
MGQPDQAVNHYNQALPIHREIGDRAGEATTLNNIGGIYFDQGDLETTIKHLDRALQLFDAIGDRANGTMVSFNLATLKAQTGDTAT